MYFIYVSYLKFGLVNKQKIIFCFKKINLKNIIYILLDLRTVDDAPTDFFIICEGDSNTQVRAISDNIQKRLKQEAATLPNHVEGQQSSLWICVDYFTTVVHVFYRETRSFYDLEELWGDAKFTEYTSL